MYMYVGRTHIHLRYLVIYLFIYLHQYYNYCVYHCFTCLRLLRLILFIHLFYSFIYCSFIYCSALLLLSFCHRAYSGQLGEYRSQCGAMLGEVFRALDTLHGMREKHQFVSQRTSALHQACEQLMEDQVVLIVTIYNTKYSICIIGIHWLTCICHMQLKYSYLYVILLLI